MKYRCLILIALIIGTVAGAWVPLRAAENALRYGDLQTCYVTGQPIPAFTITAQVTTTDTYRITHAVAVNDQAPGPAVTVYEGPIDAATPQVVTITGGSATVPGSYTLTGSIYLLSTGVLLAQTRASVPVANPCPVPATPTATPPASPTASPADPHQPAERMADIQWSQTSTPSQGAPVGAVVTIMVRSQNLGNTAGSSDALLTYDPQLLRLLDARPQSPSDWIRSRDDERGTLTLALGQLDVDEVRQMPVRLLVLAATPSTTVTLVRDDAQDRGNPLVLQLGQEIDGPLPLVIVQTAAGVQVRGRGYKPGEPLALWSNQQAGAPTTIGGVFTALADTAGTIAIDLPYLDPEVTSVVVSGQVSGVVGLAVVAPHAR